MRDLTRREAIAIGLGVIIAAAGSAPVPAVSAPIEVMLEPAWIVGTPGEYDWQHVTGRTEQEAIRNFVCDAIGGDGCEEGSPPDCDCEWCYTIGGVEAERKPEWDGIQNVTAGDWMRSGTGHICSRCGCETSPDDGGHGVGDEAVCQDCMMLADWDVVDPEHASEIREQMAADEAAA